MAPLQFPSSRIVPECDPTEWLVQAVSQIARDFDGELATCTQTSRAIQLRDRLRVCVAILLDAENRAATLTTALDKE